MAYSGEIKFMTEDYQRAIVEETPDGDLYPAAHRLVNADFSGKEDGDTITYTYDADSAENNGRDITIS